jgi:hypothetical protein|tara:strand:+ start:108 stop:287 length:180 start_codon:yes stop_codon:yes gene_type:complete
MSDITFYTNPQSRGRIVHWLLEELAEPDDKVYEFACHEGNYALPGILAGARRQEHDEQR